jgi:hypothetical protein
MLTLVLLNNPLGCYVEKWKQEGHMAGSSGEDPWWPLWGRDCGHGERWMEPRCWREDKRTEMEDRWRRGLSANAQGSSLSGFGGCGFRFGHNDFWYLQDVHMEDPKLRREISPGNTDLGVLEPCEWVASPKRTV